MSASSAPAHPPVFDLIGHTPLMPLRFAAEGLTVWAKAEFLNPSGSIKDRLARCLIEDAEARGLLRPDSIILECSSGNTGISLAMVGAAKGYQVHIAMSDTASIERRHLMHQLGAEVHLFKATKGYATGINLTLELAAREPRYFLPRQFENPINARDHEEGTAVEILEQTGGRVDAFVAGYGTGGTLVGCGRGLRRQCPNVRVFAMEPAEAAMLSGECPCCHLIEGIAGGYVPPLLVGANLDGIVKIASGEAVSMARRLSREFGLLVGTSSGGNVAAALRLARELGPDARVVTVLCDRAERYYSTPLFDH
ncbi:cysteine synthase family protein [Opitutus sp. ER46]|uniref:PLP-dependent cysteine synthase family protein n=1 Tax=Opitutus sp. ER46 TaxID=2161864 RepID=UPI000D304A93|nr:cysteine synthase family protein [Opitutus sp. ER46]PTX91465.1 cysteine synthase A [Opitutus sp. ER46]